MVLYYWVIVNTHKTVLTNGRNLACLFQQKKNIVTLKFSDHYQRQVRANIQKIILPTINSSMQPRCKLTKMQPQNYLFLIIAFFILLSSRGLMMMSAKELFSHTRYTHIFSSLHLLSPYGLNLCDRARERGNPAHTRSTHSHHVDTLVAFNLHLRIVLIHSVLVND